MNTWMRTVAALSILLCGAVFTEAATYYAANGTSGTTIWDAANAWADDTGTILASGFPNAPGDVAIFNDVAIGSVPAPTGNRVYNLNTSTNASPNSFTVGEVDFNLPLNTASASQRDTIGIGSGGSLIMDADGAGPLKAKIVVNADPTTLNIAQTTGTFTLNDDLELTIPKFGRTDFIGALRMMSTTKIEGAGGITRFGPLGSLWSLEPSGANSISYTGPTVLAGGRNRITPAGAPYQSSSFTVQASAQLEPTADGTYAFGNGVLHLNSDGTGDGASGVIRPSRTGTAPTKIEITTPTVALEAPVNLIHSEGQGINGTDPSQGFIQFDGVITGGPTNKLQLTTTGHSANHGTYVLAGTNTFSGGIDLYAGRLSTDWLQDGGIFNSATVTAHPNATFGTGDIHVFATGGNGIASVAIPNGVVNAIGDQATLTIDAGGGAFAELGDGINDLVGHLVLGGVTQTDPGTYGSSTSGATHVFDTYFTGNGVISIAASSLAGDYNGDGTVDAADYVLWRKSPGTYGGDPAGYTTWRANFGNTGSGSGSGGGLGSASVPEPSTILLMAMAIAPLVTNRRR